MTIRKVAMTNDKKENNYLNLQEDQFQWRTTGTRILHLVSVTARYTNKTIENLQLNTSLVASEENIDLLEYDILVKVTKNRCKHKNI